MNPQSARSPIHLISGAFRLALLATALIVAARAAAQGTLVNVVVDVTAEGLKAPRPLPGAPVRYFPVTVGYQEEGAWPAESLPTPIDVQRTVAQALASQGYLLLTKKAPATIALTLRWGRIAPMSASPDTQIPERDMAILLGGINMGADINQYSAYHDEFGQAAGVPRYFLTIEAYDFGSAVKKDKVPLWCARISIQAEGRTLAQAIPILAKAVVPLLGQDVRPRALWVQ
jgi:hypothetical protein